MEGRDSVELYAITRDGCLNQYPKVKVLEEKYMPSGGDFSNPKDKEAVRALEDKMIEAYGNAIVVRKCKQGESVDLTTKMIRAVHAKALGAAVDEHKVVSLNLYNNQLGDDGARAIAAVLKSNTTLTFLRCVPHAPPHTPARLPSPPITTSTTPPAVSSR